MKSAITNNNFNYFINLYNYNYKMDLIYNI